MRRRQVLAAALVVLLLLLCAFLVGRISTPPAEPGHGDPAPAAAETDARHDTADPQPGAADSPPRPTRKRRATNRSPANGTSQTEARPSPQESEADARRSAIEKQIRELRDAQRDTKDEDDLRAARERQHGAPPGTFQLHFEQGFSIERGEVVPASEADVVFDRCAGGITTIGFVAPGGIVNLETVVDRRDGPQPTSLELYHGLVGVDSTVVKLGVSAQANSWRPGSDVMVVKTRGGGWAKVMVSKRGREGRDWTKWLAALRYEFNPREPHFGAQGADWEERSGFRFAVGSRGHPIVAGLSGKRVPVPAGAPDTEGFVPRVADSQEVLLSRAHGYETATYSFEHGRRDAAPEIRNDWDLSFVKTDFAVRMVTDDVSTITDQGRVTWTELANRGLLRLGVENSVPVRHGHVYVVHTQDSDARHFAAFRVTGLEPRERVAIEWIAWLRDRSVSSPALDATGNARATLGGLLRRLTVSGRQFDAAELPTPEAIGLYAALASARGDLLVAGDSTLASLVAVYAEFLPVDVAPGVSDRTLAARLDFSGSLTLAAALDLATRQSGAGWMIDPAGTIRIVPVSTSR